MSSDIQGALSLSKTKEYEVRTFKPSSIIFVKMFSYAKDERVLEEIRKSLTAYFAQRVERDMDKLWDEGL